MSIQDDPLVSVLPIRISNAMAQEVHLHQFPLLTRPLQVPPSAAQSGKYITARIKPNASRIEIHVPIDSRPEVWNKERARELGQARTEDNQEKGSVDGIGKQKESSEQRLTEARMRSERVPERGVYMLGIVRDGSLYLHPISQVHQLRPTLAYMDALSRKSTRRSRGEDGSDSELDDGPPPDPDDPVAIVAARKEKAPKPTEVKEVHVAFKKADDKSAPGAQAGLSSVRREMLQMITTEDEEPWQEMTFHAGETVEAASAFDSVFAAGDEVLTCTTDMSQLLNDAHLPP